jgi:hypothetical protein
VWFLTVVASINRPRCCAGHLFGQGAFLWKLFSEFKVGGELLTLSAFVCIWEVSFWGKKTCILYILISNEGLDTKHIPSLLESCCGGGGGLCKGNLTDLRRILHLSLAKGNPK